MKKTLRNIWFEVKRSTQYFSFILKTTNEWYFDKYAHPHKTSMQVFSNAVLLSAVQTKCNSSSQALQHLIEVIYFICKQVRQS